MITRAMTMTSKNESAANDAIANESTATTVESAVHDEQHE